MDLSHEAEILRNVPLFGGLPPAQLKLLAFTGSAQRFEPGDVLMAKGDRADSAYVVLDGEVEVINISRGGGEFVVAVQGRNSFVGEMGVICDAPRSATVRAKTAVRALRISGEVFLRLACENPQRALYVMRQLSNRMAQDLTVIAALREELEEARGALARAAK